MGAQAVKELPIVGLPGRQRRSWRDAIDSGPVRVGHLAMMPGATTEADLADWPLHRVTSRQFAISAGRPVARPRRWRQAGIAVVVGVLTVLALVGLQLDSKVVLVAAGLICLATWWLATVGVSAGRQCLICWATPSSARRRSVRPAAMGATSPSRRVA
jgi:hypothetical protein